MMKMIETRAILRQITRIQGIRARMRSLATTMEAATTMAIPHRRKTMAMNPNAAAVGVASAVARIMITMAMRATAVIVAEVEWLLGFYQWQTWGSCLIISFIVLVLFAYELMTLYHSLSIAHICLPESYLMYGMFSSWLVLKCLKSRQVLSIINHRQSLYERVPYGFVLRSNPPYS